MADEVVIVDDKGTEHHFPAGFDPVKAGAIVRAQAGATTPAPKDTAPSPTMSVAPTASPLATATAYGAQALIPRAVPAVNQAAEFVAQSPQAQKIIAGATAVGLGKIVGVGSTPVEMLAEAYFGSKGKDMVAQLAARIAQNTAAVKATVGRAANGQFTSLTAPAVRGMLPSVLKKLGQGVGMMSAEGDALSSLNSPEALAQLKAKMTPQPWQPNAKDTRSDGSMKGNGFLGPLPRKDGGVSSEISIGVNIDGKEMEIPTLVPTLTESEKQWLLSNDVSKAQNIPGPIIDKAVAFARQRIAKGQSPFAESR